MKFSLVLFAASAMALTPTLTERDGATVSSAIASISSAVSNLQTAVQGFTGTGQVASLQSAAAAVLTAINNGNTAVAATTPLTQDEALPLAGSIQSLSSLVNSTVAATIAKKSTFVSAGVGGVVYSQLMQFKSASQTFATTTTGKVPSGLQQIATNLSQPIIDSLNAGIAAFADQANAGTSMASSGSASATASSSAAASSSASASMTSAASSSATSAAGSATSSILSPATSKAGAAPTDVAGYAGMAFAAAAAMVAAL